MERIYNFNTILSNLSNNNFIAFIATPWHFYGVKCIIEELRNKNIKLQGYIVILPTIPDSKQYYVNSSNLNLDGLEEFKIIKCSLEKSQENIFSLFIKQFLYCIKREQKGSFFYVVNPGLPSYDTAQKIAKIYFKEVYNIVIDEGLATYMGVADDFNILQIDTYIKYIKKNIRMFFVFMLKKRKKNLYYFTLFQGKIKNLNLNDNVIRQYKRMLSYDDEKVEKKKSFKNTIIILTQPFVEVGEIYGDLDNRILKDVVNYLHRMCDFEILVKTHPKEINQSKYNGLGCEIDRSLEIPFEKLMSQCIDKPIAVIGFTSTALVTASIFWNIPAYSLCLFLNGKEVSKELKRIVKKFLTGFKNYIKVIKNLEEIRF